MRSYNIAVFMGTSGSGDFEMGTNTLRALSRVEGQKIIHIDSKKIYNQNGVLKTPEIIDHQLKVNDVDIVLFTSDADYEFSIEYFSCLRKSYFLIMITGDDEHYFDKSSRYYSQAFDLVLTGNPLCMQRYELYGVDTILLIPGFDVSHAKRSHCRKNIEVCFIGLIAGKVGRKEYLDVLLGNGISVEIFGIGTPGGPVTRERMNELYAASKIGLGFAGVSFSSCLDKNITINRRIKQIKGRAQEIALTGTFVLTEYVPGIEIVFDIGSEIDVFHDEDELLAKVKYYLKNDAEREKMAARAFEKVLRDCDEINVWEKLLMGVDKKIELKNKRKAGRRNHIYKDPIFNRAYSAFHLFKMFEFFLARKLKVALDEFVVYVRSPLFDLGVFSYYVQRFFYDTHWLRILVQKIRNKL